MSAYLPSMGPFAAFCFLGTAVTGVSRTKVVGGEAGQIVSDGEFVVVKLRTWFDPSTISPDRSNGPLTPNGREAILTDCKGREYLPSPRTTDVLEARQVHSTPLSTPLRPGESYTSYLVFEVPARTQGLRLWVRSRADVGASLWGNEQSPLHGKARF